MYLTKPPSCEDSLRRNVTGFCCWAPLVVVWLESFCDGKLIVTSCCHLAQVLVVCRGTTSGLAKLACVWFDTSACIVEIAKKRSKERSMCDNRATYYSLLIGWIGYKVTEWGMFVVTHASLGCSHTDNGVVGGQCNKDHICACHLVWD